MYRHKKRLKNQRIYEHVYGHVPPKQRGQVEQRINEKQRTWGPVGPNPEAAEYRKKLVPARLTSGYLVPSYLPWHKEGYGTEDTINSNT